MNIIPTTQLTLVRARKEMEKAYYNSDWNLVRECDEYLGVVLNQAFDDPNKNHLMLTGELDNILQLYSSMVGAMPDMPFLSVQ